MVIERVLFKNLANIVSILGVLPIALLFVDDGFRYLIPVIIFNNVMDDLDGILAVRLKISSAFGAALDNVCDAVAHVTVVLVVATRHGELCAALGILAVVSILIRVVSRLVATPSDSVGSPTNELARHILLALLVASQFDFAPHGVLAAIFVAHAVSLVLPYRMPGLLRGQARSIAAVASINVVLLVAWLVPITAPIVAAAFGLSYVYGFVAGTLRWAPSVASIRSRWST